MNKLTQCYSTDLNWPILMKVKKATPINLISSSGFVKWTDLLSFCFDQAHQCEVFVHVTMHPSITTFTHSFTLAALCYFTSHHKNIYVTIHPSLTVSHSAHMHTHTHTHTYTHTYTHTHTHRGTPPPTHTYTHTHIHTRTQTHTHAHTHTHTNKQTHTRTHAHIHIHTHIPVSYTHLTLPTNAEV